MSRIMGPAFAYVVDLPKTQDATRIPEGWNVQWERLCAQDANIPPKICLTHAMSVTFKGIFDQYSTPSHSTCESRFRLGVLGLYALEHPYFEQRWKDASMEDRRKHVLIGLSRSCAIARNLNDARMPYVLRRRIEAGPPQPRCTGAPGPSYRYYPQRLLHCTKNPLFLSRRRLG